MATEKPEADTYRLPENRKFWAKELADLYTVIDKIKEQEAICAQLVADEKDILRRLQKHKPTDQLNTLMQCFQHLAYVNAKLEFCRQINGFDQAIREALNDNGVQSMIKDLGELAKAVQDCKDKGYEFNMEPVPFLKGLENHKEGSFHERTEELAWSENLKAQHHQSTTRVDHMPDITMISRQNEHLKNLKARVTKEFKRIRALAGIDLEGDIEEERESIKAPMKDAMLRLPNLEDTIKATRERINDYNKLEKMATKVYASAESTAESVLQGNQLGNALKLVREVVEFLVMEYGNATSRAQPVSERGKNSGEFVDDDSDSDSLFVRE